MALYSIGASWNPEMSRYNRSIKRSLSGLHGIKGIGFAYRLNTWGPKNGPAMLPANDFKNGFVQSPSGLASPFTWIQSIVGLESVENMLLDASDTLEKVGDVINESESSLNMTIAVAAGYDSVTDAKIQSKAQAVQAESAGLNRVLADTLTAYNTIKTEVTLLKQDPTTTKEQASTVKSRASDLLNQVNLFSNSVDDSKDHLDDLIKDAQSGPGIGDALTSSAVKSISTLTWLVGGGALIYFLAPTFLPRMMSGIRKARA